MRGAPVAQIPLVDVPLSSRPLAGLDSQGIARTLGSLEGDSLGATAPEMIEMPEECARPGEVMLSPGVCGPAPAPKAAVGPVVTSTGTKLQKTAGSARGGVQSMSRTTMVLAAICGIGLIYFLGRK